MALSSEFRAKIARFENLMKSKGVARREYYSLPFRLLHRLGLEATPFHFQNPTRIGMIAGVIYSVPTVVVFWILYGKPLGLLSFLLFGVVSGVLFGAIMAVLTKQKVKRLNLPSWQEI